MIPKQSVNIFDETAADWAAGSDEQICSGCYRRGDLFVDAALSFVRPMGNILDYGCGPGRLAALLARQGFSVLGLDASPAMIEEAKRHGLDSARLEFRACPTSPGDLPNIRYDAIVCSSVIEYFPEPEQLLSWFSAALQPSGVLIISFANNRSLWRAWIRIMKLAPYRIAQKHVWSWPQFRLLLRNAGFESVRNPTYFESPLDTVRRLEFVCGSSLIGMLGLVAARKRVP